MAQRPYRSFNPFTQEVRSEYPYATDSEVDAALEAAHQAYLAFSQTTLQDKIPKLRRLVELIEERRQLIAETMIQEMGKLMPFAQFEIQLSIDIINNYIENGADFLAPKTLFDREDSRGYILYQPTGIVLGITAFNAPFLATIQKGIPNLALGNTMIFKPDESSAGISQVIRTLFEDAGLGNEVKVLFLTFDQIARLLADDRITGITYTGSTAAGSIIARTAGANLKKCELELGGSDPFLVLPDADLAKVIPRAVAGRLVLNGHACIAAKRMLVHESMYDAFVEGLVQAVSSMNIGDPMNAETQMGPLARPDLLASIQRQVKQSVDDGARLVYGGTVISGQLYTPAIFADVTPEMTCFREETFGPIFSISKYSTIEEGIELANNTPYGLS